MLEVSEVGKCLVIVGKEQQQQQQRVSSAGNMMGTLHTEHHIHENAEVIVQIKDACMHILPAVDQMQRSEEAAVSIEEEMGRVKEHLSSEPPSNATAFSEEQQLDGGEEEEEVEEETSQQQVVVGQLTPLPSAALRVMEAECPARVASPRGAVFSKILGRVI
jgi:hypothetical protein